MTVGVKQLGKLSYLAEKLTAFVGVADAHAVLAEFYQLRGAYDVGAVLDCLFS